jgi:uncharacterized membrane protein
MSSPARIADHPIHPVLVAFPIALWVFSLACDAIQLTGLGGARWADLSFYTMLAGLFGAVAVAVPSLIDYLSIRNAGAGRWRCSTWA